MPPMSMAVPRPSSEPSGSSAGSTPSAMWATMTSRTRSRRSGGQPAPAANTQPTLPPACSNSTVWLSNGSISPRSCSIAAT
jgi:hypothetical protein